EHRGARVGSRSRTAGHRAGDADGARRPRTVPAGAAVSAAGTGAGSRRRGYCRRTVVPEVFVGPHRSLAFAHGGRTPAKAFDRPAPLSLRYVQLARLAAPTERG